MTQVRVLKRHIEACQRRKLKTRHKGKVKVFRGAWDCTTDPIGRAVGERLKADGVVVRPEAGYLQVHHGGRLSYYALPPVDVVAWWDEVDARTAQPFVFELKPIERPKGLSGHSVYKRQADGTWRCVKGPDRRRQAA